MDPGSWGQGDKGPPYRGWSIPSAKEFPGNLPWNWGTKSIRSHSDPRTPGRSCPDPLRVKLPGETVLSPQLPRVEKVFEPALEVGLVLVLPTTAQPAAFGLIGVGQKL